MTLEIESHTSASCSTPHEVVVWTWNSALWSHARSRALCAMSCWTAYSKPIRLDLWCSNIISWSLLGIQASSLMDKHEINVFFQSSDHEYLLFACIIQWHFNDTDAILVCSQHRIFIMSSCILIWPNNTDKMPDKNLLLTDYW